MNQLDQLELSEHYWTQLATVDGRATTPFSGKDNLGTFAVSIGGTSPYEGLTGGGKRHPLDVGFLVGAREIHILSFSDNRFREMLQEEVPGGDPKLADTLEELRLKFRQVSSIEDAWQANWVAALKRYPNLKRIEIERIGTGAPGVVWHGGKLAADLNEKLPGVEVVDTSSR
jgi:hypothetical protein